MRALAIRASSNGLSTCRVVSDLEHLKDERVRRGAIFVALGVRVEARVAWENRVAQHLVEEQCPLALVLDADEDNYYLLVPHREHANPATKLFVAWLEDELSSS